MYSWEIKETIDRHGGTLPATLYLGILKTSPQIIYAARVDNNLYEIATNDGSHLRFYVVADT